MYMYIKIVCLFCSLINAVESPEELIQKIKNTGMKASIRICF